MAVNTHTGNVHYPKKSVEKISSFRIAKRYPRYENDDQHRKCYFPEHSSNPSLPSRCHCHAIASHGSTIRKVATCSKAAHIDDFTTSLGHMELFHATNSGKYSKEPRYAISRVVGSLKQTIVGPKYRAR